MLVPASIAGFIPGTPVEYHGSLTDHHGQRWVVADVCDCHACDEEESFARAVGAPVPDPRWVLTDHRSSLNHVRAESFTPLAQLHD
jgi:hypothetical protein